MEARSSTNTGRQRRWLSFLLFAACLLTIIYAWVVLTDALPWLRGPKPWPPEWQWPYAPLSRSPAGRIGAQVGLVVASLAAAALFMRLSGRRRVRSVLALAVLFFALWQLIQTWMRDQSLLDALIFRTYAPVLKGFFLAPAQVASVGETLRHYAAAMPDFFSDRALTHPPGLFIFYAVANGLFERMPHFSAWFAPIARSWALPGRDWPQLADYLVASAFATFWVQVIVTLIWWVLDLSPEVRQCDFPAFNHVVTGSDALVAQVDGLALLSRDGWPGDVLLQRYKIVVPKPGTYTWRVGLYSRADGGRSQLTTGGDFVDLAPLVVR